MTTAAKKLTTGCVAELKEASAVGASTAFAQFAGATLLAGRPVVRGADDPLEFGVWKMGIFFEIHGEFAGDIAILLSPPTCTAVTAVLEEMMDDAPSSEACESIVLELGNVVASQIVSAIADRLNGRIVLSIPHMVIDGVDRELAWRARRHSTQSGNGPSTAPKTQRLETEFVDHTGELRALVVLMPELEQSEEASDTVES